MISYNITLAKNYTKFICKVLIENQVIELPASSMISGTKIRQYFDFGYQSVSLIYITFAVNIIKKMNKNVKLEKWQAAQKRHRLSDKQVQMGRELGLNPDKLGKIDNHKQETWKSPLPQFIEEIYFKRFKKTAPDVVKSIREQIADEKIKKERQKKAKEQKRKEKTKIQEDKSFVDDCGENENPAKPVIT
jgi:hypothetical protein